jgi:hypothetical protein
MALQNLQQYGCQAGNKLKEKSRQFVYTNKNHNKNKMENKKNITLS